MRSEISGLLKCAKKYSTEKFSDLANLLPENDFENFLKSYFSVPMLHIFPYQKSNRPSRDRFFQSIECYCKSKRYGVSHQYIISKIFIVYISEYIFDEISSSLEDCILETHSRATEVWSQVGAVDAQLQLIKNEINAYFQNEMERVGGFSVDARQISKDGIKYSPDDSVEYVVNSLSLTLKFLANKFNWTKNGIFVFPKIEENSFSQTENTFLIQKLAIAWSRLEALSAQCMLFDGVVGTYQGLNSQKNSNFYVFEPQLGLFEKFDYIANLRLIELSTRTFFNVVSDEITESFVVSNINDISSEGDLKFLSHQEISALSYLNSLYCENFLTDVSEYGGLTVKEWVRGYASLMSFCQNYLDSTSTIINCELNELIAYLKLGGLPEEKGFQFVNSITFSATARDLFDCPLLKIEDSSYSIVKDIVNGISISHVVISKLSSLKVSIENKGLSFESEFINMLKRRNIKAKDLKFRRGREEYEYDTVFVMDKKVFVAECKNVNLSNSNPVMSKTFLHNLDAFVRQLNRLTKALRIYPEVLDEHFSINIANYEVIPILVNSLPFSWQGTYKGVYITDMPSIERFLKSKHITLSSSRQGKPQEDKSKNIFTLWKGNSPTSEDLINQLRSPIQLELYLNNIEIRNTIFEISDTIAFGDSYLHADFMTGVERKFGEIDFN
jgi:hypothetical protein